MSDAKEAIGTFAGEQALCESDVAQWLGLSVATLRAWRFRQTGPRFVRFGRSVRYMRGDVEAFISASMVETNGATE